MSTSRKYCATHQGRFRTGLAGRLAWILAHALRILRPSPRASRGLRPPNHETISTERHLYDALYLFCGCDPKKLRFAGVCAAFETWTNIARARCKPSAAFQWQGLDAKNASPNCRFCSHNLCGGRSNPIPLRCVKRGCAVVRPKGEDLQTGRKANRASHQSLTESRRQSDIDIKTAACCKL